MKFNATSDKNSKETQHLLTDNPAANYQATKSTIIRLQLNSECTNFKSFPYPTDCQNVEHTIENCNAMKRIMDLLNLYEKHKNV